MPLPEEPRPTLRGEAGYHPHRAEQTPLINIREHLLLAAAATSPAGR